MTGTFLAARAADLGTDVPHLLNLKPNEVKRQPLKQHSLSDLNRVNSKPTVRLIEKGSNPSPDKIYEQSPFPRLPSQVLKPTNGAENSQPPSPMPTPELDFDSRPSTRQGQQPTIPKALYLHAGHARRTSISTTTSNADTLVANSVFSPTTAVFSPTSQRFSIDSDHKTPIGALEPLDELPNEKSGHFSQSDDDESDHEARLPLPLPARMKPTAVHGYTVAPLGGPGDSSFIMPSRSGALDDDDQSVSLHDESRPSTSHQIRYVSSSESIRPQFASIRPSAPPPARPEAELWLDDRTESMPSLGVARKRAHVHSASLTSLTSQSRTLANPAHLSTIASESDVNYARLTYDSPALGGPAWPRKRRTTVASSAYSDSMASPRLGNDTTLQTSSSYGSIPDLISRENSSAIPEPLFSSSPIAQEPFQPGHAHNTSELDDTIGELQPPGHHPLREKRSGYILKSRSHTEFKSSYTLGGERWTESLFPAWARKFYGGKAYLLSNNASRITLGGSRLENASCVSLAQSTGGPVGPRPPTRGKFWRHATTDSLGNLSPGTRPGSGLSNWETIYSRSSPPTSRMPSVLKPRGAAGKGITGRARGKSTPTPRTGLNVMTASRDSVEISELPGDIPPVPSLDPNITTSSAATSSWVRKLRTKASFRNPLKSHTTQSEAPNDPDAMLETTTTPDGHEITRQITWRTRSHTVGTIPTEPSIANMPHLTQNKRLEGQTPMFRVPSFDEPLREKWMGPCNRQILAFCIGFMFPPLWIIASFLPLPHRPSNAFSIEVDSVMEVDEKGREKLDDDVAAVSPTWSWEQERVFLKAKWWQTLNRIMSVVGLGIMALIIALAVLAAS